jgi:hypothetical protein
MAFEKYSTSGILLFAVPLFGAPVLAGWAVAPWAVLPVFAALFGAQTTLTRRMPDRAGTAIATALAVLAINAALVGVLMGLGHGLAMLTGPLPMPVWGAVLICAGATGYAIWRYRWTPEQAEMDALMDQMTAVISDMAPLPDIAPPQTPPQILDALARLRDQPNTDLDMLAAGLYDTLDSDAFDWMFDLDLPPDDPLCGSERRELLLMRLLAIPRIRHVQSELGGAGAMAERALISPHPKVRQEARALMDQMMAEDCEADCFPLLHDLEDAEISFPAEFRGIGAALRAHIAKQRLAEQPGTG